MTFFALPKWGGRPDLAGSAANAFVARSAAVIPRSALAPAWSMSRRVSPSQRRLREPRIRSIRPLRKSSEYQPCLIIAYPIGRVYEGCPVGAGRFESHSQIQHNLGKAKKVGEKKGT